MRLLVEPHGQPEPSPQAKRDRHRRDSKVPLIMLRHGLQAAFEVHLSQCIRILEPVLPFQRKRLQDQNRGAPGELALDGGSDGVP